jgi:hypothetical protein
VGEINWVYLDNARIRLSSYAYGCGLSEETKQRHADILNNHSELSLNYIRERSNFVLPCSFLNGTTSLFSCWDMETLGGDSLNFGVAFY